MDEIQANLPGYATLKGSVFCVPINKNDVNLLIC